MREWSPHSFEKLEVFTDYVNAFVKASGRAPERVYLDAFAGDTVNKLKTTGEIFPGSPEIALKALPQFTHVRLFELNRRRVADLRKMASNYSSTRDVRVVGGDANEEIPKALSELPTTAPTLAFLDPDGLELSWKTITAIADHKRSFAEAKGKSKVEMWILFSSSAFTRMLTNDVDYATSQQFPQKIGALYGATGPWERIWQAKRDGELTDAQSKQCYAFLYIDRLATLGYKYFHARPFHPTRGGELYVMIHASDHEVGTKIMGAVSTKKRAIKRAPTLFDIPEERPQMARPWEGWRDELAFVLPEWKEL
jgi:three-Cys-motif partner protein